MRQDLGEQIRREIELSDYFQPGQVALHTGEARAAGIIAQLEKQSGRCSGSLFGIGNLLVFSACSALVDY
jgi:hypothetical protein